MDVFAPFGSPMVDALWLIFVPPLVAGIAAVICWVIVDKVRLRRQDRAEAALAANAIEKVRP